MNVSQHIRAPKPPPETLYTARKLAGAALTETAHLYATGAVPTGKDEYYQAGPDETLTLKASVMNTVAMLLSGRPPAPAGRRPHQLEANIASHELMNGAPEAQRIAFTLARAALAKVEPYASHPIIRRAKTADPHGWKLNAPYIINDQLLPDGEHRLKAILEWLTAAICEIEHRTP